MVDGKIEYKTKTADAYYMRPRALAHRQAHPLKLGEMPPLMHVERHVWETYPVESPILVTGIEDGRFALFLASLGHKVVGIDGSKQAMFDCIRNQRTMQIPESHLIMKRKFFEEIPVTATPFGQFGTVIIMNELEREEDPAPLIAKAVQMAKYNVILFMPKLRSYHEPMRRQFLSADDLQYLIRTAVSSDVLGWSVEEIMRSTADENTKHRMLLALIIKEAPMEYGT